MAYQFDFQSFLDRGTSPDWIAQWNVECTQLLDQQQAAGIEPPAGPIKSPWQCRGLAGRRALSTLSDPLLILGTCPDCHQSFIAAVRAEMTDWRQRRKERAEANGKQWFHPTISRAQRCDHCQLARTRQLKAVGARRRRALAAVQRTAVCEHCNTTFHPQRSTARFCSTRCRVAASRAAASTVESTDQSQ